MAALLGRSVQSLAGGLEAAAGDGSEGGAHPWRQGANARRQHLAQTAVSTDADVLEHLSSLFRRPMPDAFQIS